MTDVLHEPGWWLLAVVTVTQLVAEPLRRWIDRHRSDARAYRGAARVLRRQPALATGQPTPAMLRRTADRLRWEADLAQAVLVTTWLGAQLTAWTVHVNSDWTTLPHIDDIQLQTIAASETAVCLLLLWWALRRAGESAALERAVAHLVLIAVATAGVAVMVDADHRPGTVLSVLVIALSPLVRRIIVTAARPRAPALVPPEAYDLLAWLGQGWPPTDPDPPLIDVVPRTDIILRAPLGHHGHIYHATRPGSFEPLVFKEFGAAGQAPVRNPIRPLASYQELLSRGGRLTPAERSVLLWPKAVVAEGNDAVGVLYDLIGPPFQRGGEKGAQTGEFLLASEPEHSYCQLPSIIQRGQILYDIVLAHELLRRLGLAHGDTGWGNFVYGIANGIGRGMLIDIDGATAVDDPHAPKLHQHFWDVPQTLPPARRDELRVAMLIARLAALTPQPDSKDIPDNAVFWFTPRLRQLCAVELAKTSNKTSQVLSHFRSALAEALSQPTRR